MTEEKKSGMLEWREGFFRDVDARDIRRLAPWLSEDVEMRFGNQPALHGKPAVIEALSGFFETISAMSHRLKDVVVEGQSAASEALVTYTRPDGSTLILPVCSVFRVTSDGLLASLRIYIDISDLYSDTGGGQSAQ